MNISRWNQLLINLQIRPEEQAYQKLTSAYSEKHRAYHTINHINDCLTQFDRFSDLLEDANAVEVAIWFHDAIYNPLSNTNEVDSAKWASKFLSANGAPSELVESVYRLIIATKHDVALTSNDEAVLVDIDLSILGSEPAEYRQFEENVRTEYRLMPGPIFRRKRAEILQSFLDRDYIYNIQRFRDMYEDMARSNLETAIQRLRE